MQDRSYYCFEFFHFGDKMNAYIYTYLNRNVIEFSDKSMFDPINKIFRRYNGNQIRADHIKMLCKDKNVITTLNFRITTLNFYPSLAVIVIFWQLCSS